MPDAESTLAYLDKSLRMDPLMESASIIAARAAFLGVKRPEPRGSAGHATAVSDRESVHAALVELRERFGELDTEQVLERADAIDASAFPDLESWRERIGRCAEAAGAFEEARADSRIAERQLDRLLQIAVQNDEDASHLGGKLLPKTAEKKYAKSARVVQKEYAELYDLAPEWFDRIRSLKRERKLAAKPGVLGGYALGTYFLIRLVIKLVQYLMENGS